MRAVFITPIIPSSTGNGLAMRASVWLETLARRFETDVVAAALFAPHETAEDFTAALARSITMLRGTLCSVPGQPRVVPTLDDPSASALREVLATADVVVVFRLYLAGLAEQARELGIPVVVDLDDLDWVREERLGDLDEAAAYRTYADDVIGVATVATTAASADASSGAALLPGPAWMQVPNGVRPAHASLVAPVPDIDLLFVATLGYGPNIDAAEWLVHEVLPRLPGTTAALVGADPVPPVRALAGETVTVAGDVPDVTPWYERSRVCVVPIRSGSGTRTKIPEAWVHGRPVVSTTIGAEGIDAAGAIMIADDAEGFAAACAHLLADASAAQRLVAAGTSRAEAHSVEVAMAQADAAIDRAMTLAGRTPPPRIPA